MKESDYRMYKSIISKLEFMDFVRKLYKDNFYDDYENLSFKLCPDLVMLKDRKYINITDNYIYPSFGDQRDGFFTHRYNLEHTLTFSLFENLNDSNFVDRRHSYNIKYKHITFDMIKDTNMDKEYIYRQYQICLDIMTKRFAELHNIDYLHQPNNQNIVVPFQHFNSDNIKKETDIGLITIIDKKKYDEWCVLGKDFINNLIYRFAMEVNFLKKIGVQILYNKIGNASSRYFSKYNDILDRPPREIYVFCTSCIDYDYDSEYEFDSFKSSFFDPIYNGYKVPVLGRHVFCIPLHLCSNLPNKLLDRVKYKSCFPDTVFMQKIFNVYKEKIFRSIHLRENNESEFDNGVFLKCTNDMLYLKKYLIVLCM